MGCFSSRACPRCGGCEGSAAVGPPCSCPPDKKSVDGGVAPGPTARPPSNTQHHLRIIGGGTQETIAGSPAKRGVQHRRGRAPRGSTHARLPGTGTAIGHAHRLTERDILNPARMVAAEGLVPPANPADYSPRASHSRAAPPRPAHRSGRSIDDDVLGEGSVYLESHMGSPSMCFDESLLVRRRADSVGDAETNDHDFLSQPNSALCSDDEGTRRASARYTQHLRTRAHHVRRHSTSSAHERARSNGVEQRYRIRPRLSSSALPGLVPAHAPGTSRSLASPLVMTPGYGRVDASEEESPAFNPNCSPLSETRSLAHYTHPPSSTHQSHQSRTITRTHHRALSDSSAFTSSSLVLDMHGHGHGGGHSREGGGHSHGGAHESRPLVNPLSGTVSPRTATYQHTPTYGPTLTIILATPSGGALSLPPYSSQHGHPRTSLSLRPMSPLSPLDDQSSPTASMPPSAPVSPPLSSPLNSP